MKKTRNTANRAEAPCSALVEELDMASHMALEIAHDRDGAMLLARAAGEIRRLEKTRLNFAVYAAPGCGPLAMFREKVWADEWREKYCVTASIETVGQNVRGQVRRAHRV